MLKKIPCAVPILTLNSGKTLERCLDGVKDVQEIIVMDGNSTDNTLEIAKRYGAKIYKQVETDEPEVKIKNFTKMRLKLWSKVTEPWFFLLDSDEFATPELMEEIRQIVSKNEKNVAYEIPRLQIIDGKKVIKYSFSYPYNYLRLFHKESGITLKPKTVHEQIDIPQNVTVRLAKNYLLTELAPNKECHVKDAYYLSLALSNAHTFSWRKSLSKSWINFQKGIHIGLKSFLIYLRYGFRESLSPKYVWRFMRYHFLLALGLLKKKLKS